MHLLVILVSAILPRSCLCSVFEMHRNAAMELSSGSAAQPADKPADYADEKRRLDTGEQSVQKAMRAGMKELQDETRNDGQVAPAPADGNVLDMKITNLAGAVFEISLLINPAKMDINQERLLEQ